MNRNFAEINRQIKILISSGLVNPKIGEAKRAVPVQIESVNRHALHRGILVEEAQSFIDNAEVMFDQFTRTMFLSSDGSATVIVENKRLISVYRKEDYDPAIVAILEVLKNVN